MTKILIDLGYFRISSDSTNNKFSSLPSQNNSLTIESLFKELSCCSELMQYWDEFSTLLGSFGMYKAGKEGFDRSIFLTLYNGEADLTVSYKSFGYGINEPRISIFSAGHPDKIVELVEEEKSSRADGFISRFLVCCPEPVRLKLSQQTHYENKINILNLLVTIKLFFEKQFKFTEAAFKLMDEEIHLYNKMCAKFELSETFIGGDKLEKYIILIEGSLVSLTKFTLKKIGKSDDFEKACLKFEEKKIGKYDAKYFKSIVDKKKGAKPSKVFIKKDFNKLNEVEKVEFINSLIFYEISINQYLEKFNCFKSNDSDDDLDGIASDENQLKRSTYSTQFDENRPKK
ncbi:hypothetical protein BpHYR1_017456 [Brachionus plicatilis]|uniref:Uncharacterized protein n=1 Tax=Brachionus plicatilis TaxID=10195 RepID=A0A3M7SNB7_BRAPC|nr:hypothetical protein BpHYR1_017456 [Brachionus plicatilis]